MIKERIPISGDLKSRVKQLMEYAGWYEGRKVDISIAEKYYAAHGVPMMKTTQRFYRKYFGLCCQWYLAQKKLSWAADFEFALFPYLINGIKNHLEDAYFRDMSGCELAEIERAAGQRCQPIGHIGYYYPAEVWISEHGKLYAKYEYQDEIECFPDMACNEYYHLNLSEETRKMFSVMGLGMQTEQSCCGAFTVAVGIIGLMTAKEGQTDVSNMEGYQMIAELTDFMLSFYGTLHCVELQRLEIVGYENPCHAIVEALAKKLEELLANRRIFCPANGGQLSC